MRIGKINRYTCNHCGGVITTIDRDEGVTPMMMECLTMAGCEGHMVSSMYLVSQSLPPTHEWYKPAALRDVPAGLRDHVKMGGLLIRPVKG